MNLTSFYGGPNGQSFYIKKVFTSYYGITRESIENDIARGWTSPVSVGEFVMISYGLPGDPQYEDNRKVDLDRDEKKKRAFNATLWQKVYNEAAGNANGLDYKLIASLAGNTPKIYVEETIVLDPVENPDVTIDGSNPDKPGLTFSLPRAVKFWYGDRLGKRKDGTYVDTSEEYKDCGIGDYYINKSTGFIYLITDKKDNTCTFVFQACFQAPTPDVDTIVISPYKDDGSVNTPSVEKEFTNDEQTQWKLNFNLPKMPVARAQASAIGPLEEAQADSRVYDKDTLLFDFKIPRGSRIIPGDSIENVDVSQFKPGDYFLDGTTGSLYLYNTKNEWVLQPGTLKGPTGDALHIVASFELTETDELQNSLANGVAHLEQFYGEDYSFKSDQLYEITWVKDIVGEDGEPAQERSYYWYYKADDGNWGRVQLAGGGGLNSIINEFDPETAGPTVDKVYSVHYINELIKDEPKKDPIGSEGSKLRRTTLSTNLLIDLLSWGSYEDALGDNEPVPDVLTVNKLEIISRPNKTTYEFGDTLDTTGIIIQATKQDNSLEDIDVTEYTFSPTVFNQLGIQTVTVTYTLEDGTTVTTSFDVTVGDKQVAIPTWKEDLYYNNSYQNVDNIDYWNGYNKDYMTISAEPQMNVSSDYTATFTLKEGCTWSDGTTEPKEVGWGIQQAVISAVPVQDGVIIADGNTIQSPSWKNFNESQMTIECEAQTAPGTYIAIFTAKEGYRWSDTDDRSKTVNWEIISG